MKKEEEVYLDLNRSVLVHKSGVKVKDLGDVLCSDKTIQRKVAEITVCQMQAYKEKVQVVSALRVIDMVLKQMDNVTITNIGETDTVVMFQEKKEIQGLQKRWNQWIQILKVVFVSVTLFFGASFSIMSFHTDISIQDLFSRLHLILTGVQSDNYSVLEISYSIGIFIGVLVFFNHLGRKKVTHDPTPVQVQMREYEKTVDDTFIENVNREGKKINVE